MKDSPSGLQPVEVSAAMLFDRAITHCARRKGESSDAVLERLRACDAETHATFRYALAKGIGEYLGSLGAAIRAVYVYGSAMGEASSPCSDIDIILDLDHDTDRIDRLMRGLDIALVTQFRALFPWAKRVRSLLDVRVVAANHRKTGERYCGDLLGARTAPICLWRGQSASQGTLRADGPRRPSQVTAR